MAHHAFEELKALLPGVCMVDVIVHKHEDGTAEVVRFPFHVLVTQSKVMATLLGHNEDWNESEQKQQPKVLDMTGFCNDSVVNKKCLMLMLLTHQDQCAELQLWSLGMKTMFPESKLNKKFVPSIELDDYAKAGTEICQLMKTCLYYHSDDACEKVDEIAILYAEDFIHNERCSDDAPDTVAFVVNAERDLDMNPFTWSETILERMYWEISKAKVTGKLVEPGDSMMRFMAKDTMLKVLSYAPPYIDGNTFESDGFLGF
jgi:hypothetical protein